MSRNPSNFIQIYTHGFIRRIITVVSGTAVAIALVLESVVAVKMWRTYKVCGRMEMPDGSWISHLARMMLVSFFTLLALTYVIFI
jgi:hypothetical protein